MAVPPEVPSTDAAKSWNTTGVPGSTVVPSGMNTGIGVPSTWSTTEPTLPSPGIVKEVNVSTICAIASRFWGQYVSLHDVMLMADTLLEDARGARCEYCCQLLAGNDACLRNECPSLQELRSAER